MTCGALTLSADEKAKYPVVEVGQFDAKAEAKAPPEIGVKLTEDVMKKLADSKKFTSVLRNGEKPADAEAKVLRIAGTITAYDAGSRAARYAVGFGAGKSKISVHIQFLDAASGKVLLESDVENKFSGTVSFVGGDSSKVTDGLAKKILELASKNFL
jgi:hypothetical protein